MDRQCPNRAFLLAGLGATARTDDVRECSITWTVEIVGSKWTLLAVREPLLGSHRFAEIAQHTGASRSILTARLRALEGHGLMERRLYRKHPPVAAPPRADLTQI
ncbi:winged helix-turn-helix transcriptional regulator [Streptomyces sp. NPDC059629]|uniref:winged helix-turn-helix transcriptional regulator n=1 Tax=Streptomyces sp. NPDC059629 TaxID=3346889 RepID=UPI00368B71D3